MSFENDKYSVDKDPYEWCFRQYKGLEAIYPQLNIQMRNQKLLTQIPGELEHAVKCRCNQSFTLYDISNTLQDGGLQRQTQRKNGISGKENNSCHNCGSKDHYANSFPKAKKKVYAMEKVLEEESPTEDFEANSMGDHDQDPREEFIVEYQEETQIGIQEIQL
ncbi:hypothetical protein O181_088696 [Austropuccinia psidii MF-1]|uniref:Uncharacterized protein n=1 Tax=Austropuccinia psidii MF-1 TaxID=1389203 RepID=A0A9Q3IS11_9BASI|nr:hypothetical protein [Austropuccinia psidii MF-1]